MSRGGSRNGFPPPPQPRSAIREWDRRAVEEIGMPGAVLMESAGAGAARILAALAEEKPEDWPEPFQVLCGPGSNGGDGFVVARRLHDLGFQARILVIGVEAYAPGSDAALNHEVARRLGLPMRRTFDPPPAGEAALASGTVVDALFGTGLARPLRPPWLDWVRAMNASGRPVAALDVPSGLDADTGIPLGAAVQARVTITFAAAKLGFALHEGPRCAGEVHVLDIGIPRAIWSGGPETLPKAAGPRNR